jgi:membrane protease YdiL (CAAX protease family)
MVEHDVRSHVRRGAGNEVAAVLLTGAANFIINRLPRKAYVPANLGAASLMTWFARRLGATWSDMGLDPRRLREGVRWGLAASAPIAVAVALGVALPATRRFFVDERAARAGHRELLYHVLFRIPLGTAMPEEAMFRGGLLGIFERRRPRRVADALSGLLFGLSHILPTIDRLDNEGMVGSSEEDRRRRAMAVGGVIVATMAAGYGFAWLRDRSGSLVAPVIAHAALNGLALLGAWAVARSRAPRSISLWSRAPEPRSSRRGPGT